MKIFFTLFFTLFLLSVQSQNFYFEPTDTLNKTITTEDVSDLNIDIIRSESIDILYLDYELLTNTIPAEWYQAYCDNHGCWGSLPESGSMSPMYDEFNSFIKLSINPNSIEGSGVVQYFVYEVGDYENGLTMTFNIDTPGYVGLNSVATFEMQFYPNPIEDKLMITTSENMNKINIFNLTGQAIFQANSIQSSNYQIKSSNWKAGIYFIEVTNENGVREVRRIIKK